MLAKYLQDHLAGSEFALALLDDLGNQQTESVVAVCAKELRGEIESDQRILQEYLDCLPADRSAMKEVTAWFAQKASRAKLTMGDTFGIFEAVEFLALGVQGKIALWTVLEDLNRAGRIKVPLKLNELLQRARDQHARLESLRLELALKALLPQADS